MEQFKDNILCHEEIAHTMQTDKLLDEISEWLRDLKSENVVGWEAFFEKTLFRIQEAIRTFFLSNVCDIEGKDSIKGVTVGRLFVAKLQRARMVKNGNNAATDRYHRRHCL